MRLAALFAVLILIVAGPARADDEHPRPFDGNFEAMDVVDAALAGKQVTVNDTKTYENGAKTVPSYLLKPVVVYKDNWEKTLIDSGYYKKSQFQ